MFHWICPECGREISPQAKECAACDPSSTAQPAVVAPPAIVPVVAASQPEAPPAVKSEPLLLAAPVAVVPDEPVKSKQSKSKKPESVPAPVQPRIAGSPKPPALAIPLPVAAAGHNLSPVTSGLAAPQTPAWKQVLPLLEPARAPRISQATLRESQGVNSASRGDSPKVSSSPEHSAATPAMPSLSLPRPPGPPMGGLCNYAAVAASQIKAAKGRAKPSASDAKEHLSLPGPTLPHELTSLHAAGIAKIMVAGGQQQAARSSSWILSFTVAAAVLAGTLGAAFYAMPGFASSSPKRNVAKEVKAALVQETVERRIPTNPLARLVEVTGIRFVTDLPNRPAQIHYLVVNHSNVPLLGVTVNVTLRASGVESALSQFAFKAPRLGPYESKEMVSSIERFNKSVALPEWRNLWADVDIAQ